MKLCQALKFKRRDRIALRSLIHKQTHISLIYSVHWRQSDNKICKLNLNSVKDWTSKIKVSRMMIRSKKSTYTVEEIQEIQIFRPQIQKCELIYKRIHALASPKKKTLSCRNFQALDWKQLDTLWQISIYVTCMLISLLIKERSINY